jgi:hypothetical protein
MRLHGEAAQLEKALGQGTTVSLDGLAGTLADTLQAIQSPAQPDGTA